VVFLHGFGEHSALYHWLGNALNGAGIDCGHDKIGHGLTKGDLRLRQSIVRVRQR
jgi:alpha-beta hydrolase superfamily lysophospholipase